MHLAAEPWYVILPHVLWHNHIFHWKKEKKKNCWILKYKGFGAFCICPVPVNAMGFVKWKYFIKGRLLQHLFFLQMYHRSSQHSNFQQLKSPISPCSSSFGCPAMLTFPSSSPPSSPFFVTSVTSVTLFTRLSCSCCHIFPLFFSDWNANFKLLAIPHRGSKSGNDDHIATHRPSMDNRHCQTSEVTDLCVVLQPGPTLTHLHL